MYMEAHQTAKQWEDGSKQYATKQQLLAKAEELFALSVRKLEECNVQQEELNVWWNKFEPEVTKAREFDAKMEVVARNGKEAKAEFDKVTANKQGIEVRVVGIEKEMGQNRMQAKVLTDWFDAHSIYKELVPRTDLLVNWLNTMQQTTKHILLADKSIDSLKALIIATQKSETEAKNEAEALDKLLPAEILSLRIQLNEGSPCPVCGSIHHPLSANEIDEQQKFKEQELNDAKEKAKRELEQLAKRIETSNRELAAQLASKESLSVSEMRHWQMQNFISNNYPLGLNSLKMEHYNLIFNRLQRVGMTINRCSVS